MKLSKDQISAAIDNELSRATDYSSAALAQNRKQSWDYFLNRDRGDEVTGRSTVQDTSVRDTVNALMAAIMPAYASDHLISMEPTGPNDEDQAEAESRAINGIFTETNQGFMELSNSVQDALLFKNGVIKVWAEDIEEVSTRAFNAPAADVLAQAPPDEDWQRMDSDDGLSRFKITRQVQNLRTDSIEMGYLFTDPNQEDQQLHDANFIAELTYFTRSDLVAMGISKKVAYALPEVQDKTNNNTGGQSTIDIVAKFIDGIGDVGSASTPDRGEIECYWIHMKMDLDGDGISEKHRFLYSNRKVLLQEQVDFFPYASGTGWPVPHRWAGLSVYDLSRITQDEMTNARRQLHDNLNVANNQRPVFDPGETEAEDITTGAPGRGIRSKSPMNVAWMPIQDIVSQSLSYLQYMGQVRAEQTGATLDMQGADGQVMQSVSGISAEMQLAPRELMAAHVARNLAETLVRNLFLLIHRTLRQDWKGPLMFNRSGDWQETNPAEWQPRTRLNVNVGLSPGERRRKSASLQFVLQMQMQMIQGGTANITTNWNGVHSALTDWMQSVELDSHEGYFLDPDGKQSQQGQQAAMQQSQQQQQMQQQMQQVQMQMEQMDKDLEKAKIAEDARQADAELKFKYFDALLDADTEDAKLDAQIEAGTGDSAPGAVAGDADNRRDAA